MTVRASPTPSRFQSTPPRGGATSGPCTSAMAGEFQSTPPRGGATLTAISDICISIFQSTPPRGGATAVGQHRAGLLRNFNPRPREGGRQHDAFIIGSVEEFQSTPPRGGATSFEGGGRVTELFQSTPPRGGATTREEIGTDEIPISIHAPARGGDLHPGVWALPLGHFNPRPREGGRRYGMA